MQVEQKRMRQEPEIVPKDAHSQDTDFRDTETRKRLVHNARELCEYATLVRTQLRQKERGSL